MEKYVINDFSTRQGQGQAPKAPGVGLVFIQIMNPNCPQNFRFLGCLVIEIYKSLVQNETTVVLLSEVPVVLIQKLQSGSSMKGHNKTTRY